MNGTSLALFGLVMWVREAGCVPKFYGDRYPLRVKWKELKHQNGLGVPRQMRR